MSDRYLPFSSAELQSDLDMADWPKENNRFLCTPEKPMPKPAPKGCWTHMSAETVDSEYGGLSHGDYDINQCTACGTRWRETLPN